MRCPYDDRKMAMWDAIGSVLVEPHAVSVEIVWNRLLRCCRERRRRAIGRALDNESA